VTQVIWAPSAIQDVEAIRAHVARDSTHYGDLVVERIVAAVERLKDYPRSGRIVYRLRRDVVEIATVFHGARLFHLD